MGRVKPPCAHCHGSGLCEQICCTLLGNTRRMGDQVIRVCMVCRGTGQAS